MINISQSAQDYLHSLVKNQGASGILIQVHRGGTPKAETTLSFARTENPDWVLQQHGDLKAFITPDSERWLADAEIDYVTEGANTQLTIRAPNSKMPQVDENSSLTERVNYVLWNTINPNLAAHGGEVELMKITDDGVAVLSFGGGCQGCSQVDITLKQGVELELLDQVSELTGILDVTDHSDDTNAYYKAPQ
jgi:Fe/S biogenesis protein NfuA